MCRACRQDLTALTDERARLASIEAECCARRFEIDTTIDRILDGLHTDPAVAPVLPPWANS
jgi:hypothetical protein